VSSPYAYNQVIYVGCNDYSLYAIHIITGALRWKFTTAGAISSSPLVANSTIYVGSNDKYVYALDTLGAAIRWKTNVNGAINTSPVLIDSTKKVTYPAVSGNSDF
jgi:outer membrane protein assembly factor BamB